MPSFLQSKLNSFGDLHLAHWSHYGIILWATAVIIVGVQYFDDLIGRFVTPSVSFIVKIAVSATLIPMLWRRGWLMLTFRRNLVMGRLTASLI